MANLGTVVVETTVKHSFVPASQSAMPAGVVAVRCRQVFVRSYEQCHSVVVSDTAAVAVAGTDCTPAAHNLEDEEVGHDAEEVDHIWPVVVRGHNLVKVAGMRDVDMDVE